MAEISIIKFRIMPTLLHERIVVALLDNFALAQHNDTVCAANGTQPVGNQDRSRLGKDFIECFLNLRFCKRVNTGGRFIKDENWRLLQQNTQLTHQLTLPHT